jgi:acyl-coenzyme A synthetase/AMP-(fatty) acid ligase/acyl carrier protein
MVEHRSLVNYLTWVNRQLLGAHAQLVPATANPSFDASLKQLFAPLVAGRAVWLVPESVVADPKRLLEHLSCGDSVTLNCVPWLWKVLLEILESGDCAVPPPIERLLIGGEELTQELVDRTFERLPHVELWNLYGPTETTANATAARLYPGERTSIGRPIANTVALVLDGFGQLAPVGVQGELHVGGVGVARGYWRHPAMTAERFVANPFQSGRLYRTGDVVRQRADGCLEFLGRLDHQVKLRGLRIELGEIEARLEAHTAVRQAAVTLDGSTGSPRLIAYVERRPGSGVTSAELRTFTRAALPAYMVPAVFVATDSLPRTVHGKIDRLALPGMHARNDDEEVAAPRGPDAQRVAAIWASVLRINTIDTRYNFFELGGHSLLLTQAIARVRNTFGVEIPLRAVFEDPTLQGFVDAIARARAAPGPAVAAIARIDRESRRIRVEGGANGDQRKAER